MKTIFRHIILAICLIQYLISFGQQAIVPSDSITKQPIPQAIATDSTEMEITRDSTLRNEPVTYQISTDTLDAPITYEARDSIIYDLIDQKIYLYGAAWMKQKDVRLDAGYIIMNQKTKTLQAFYVLDSLGQKINRPTFQDGDQKFSSDEIAYNFETKKGTVNQLVTQQGDGFLVGEKVKKDENNELYAYKAYYTTCDLEHPHFKIVSKKVKVIPNKLIATGPAELYIADIPTPLVLPFGLFPLQKDRTSGILLPTYGESPSKGFYFRDGGFYLGFSDYIDLAIRGEIFTKGSWSLSSKSTYAKRYKYRGNISLSYNVNVENDPLETSYKKSKDFNVTWAHNQDAKSWPNNTFSTDVNFVTSTYDRNRFLANQANPNNTYSSGISYGHTFRKSNANLTASMRVFQNISAKTTDVTLPEMAFSLPRKNPFARKIRVGNLKWYENITLNYNANLKNSVSDADSIIFSNQIWDKFKYGISHSAKLSTSTKLAKYITVNPNMTINQRLYGDYIFKYWDNTTPIIDTTLSDGEILSIDTTYGVLKSLKKVGFKAPVDLNFSLALSTNFYGLVKFKSQKINAIRHVVSPSISLNYVPDYTNFWGNYYNRVQTDTSQTPDKYKWYSKYQDNIYQGPPLGNNFGLTYGIRQSLEIKVRSKNDTIESYKKISIFDNITLNSGYNFIADSFSMSKITLSGNTKLFNQTTLNFGASFDPYGSDATGKRVSTYAINNGQKILRFESVDLSTSLSLPLTKNETKTKSESDPNGNKKQLEDIVVNTIPNTIPEYIDFDIPWKLSLTYKLDIRKNYNPETRSYKVIQVITGNGEVNITPKWKLTMSSGYDFELKKLSSTAISIHRDLHCWEMSFNWRPIGQYKSYDFTIRVRSEMLKDLKLERRRTWQDYDY